MIRQSLAMLIVVAMLGPGRLCGQPQGSGGDPSVEKLIRRLEDPDFRIRNAAEQRLVELGTVTIATLEAAAASGGAELRYRLERVLTELRKLRAQEQIEHLKENPWMVGGKITDVWEVFHELAGDSAASRALFISMMKSDPQLTLAPAADAAQERALLESRCMELRNLQQLLHDQPVRAGHVAAILFVTLASRQKPSPLTVSTANSVIDSPDFLQKLNDSRVGGPLRALLAHWIMRSGLVSAHSRLMLAMRYDIPEGVVPAREMISNGDLKTSRPEIPILYLARHAGIGALADLEPLLAETKVVASSTQRTAEGEVRFTSEVRDVALAALLYITRQDPRAYGFDRIKSDPRYIYSPGSIGFEKETQRRNAFARWQQWRERHLQHPLKPWPDASEGTLVDARSRRPDPGFGRTPCESSTRRRAGGSLPCVSRGRAFCRKFKLNMREAELT